MFGFVNVYNYLDKRAYPTNASKNDKRKFVLEVNRIQ